MAAAVAELVVAAAAVGPHSDDDAARTPVPLACARRSQCDEEAPCSAGVEDDTQWRPRTETEPPRLAPVPPGTCLRAIADSAAEHRVAPEPQDSVAGQPVRSLPGPVPCHPSRSAAPGTAS